MTKSFRDLFLISSCLSFIVFPAQSADKLEVLDSYFFAQLASDDKNELRTKTTRIPNIPDQICFGWVINVTPSDELAKITEIFTLPTAPKVWGGVEDDPYSQTTTTQDRKNRHNKPLRQPQKR